MESGAASFDHHKCKDQGYQIPEKALFNRRKISGKLYKCIHPCKAERRQDDADDPPNLLVF